ncbi:MAG: hypothetical protein HY077_02415 [Elusimicrobia bacterium]|nr:hypothetical protein [Elusimicrobiota bacterium]
MRQHADAVWTAHRSGKWDGATRSPKHGARREAAKGPGTCRVPAARVGLKAVRTP